MTTHTVLLPKKTESTMIELDFITTLITLPSRISTVNTQQVAQRSINIFLHILIFNKYEFSGRLN